MRLPKIRELREALVAVFSPRFTTKFPKRPCIVPEKYRGKPEIDIDTCVGCGACVNVCPTEALTQIDDLEADPPTRTLQLCYDACIFCGNCQENCTTETGIALSNEWDLATLDRDETVTTQEFELQICDRCGAVVGTKKHLVWLYDRLGPQAYTNPSLLLAKAREISAIPPDTKSDSVDSAVQTRDFMKVLCPKCKYELNIKF